jgi:transposase
VLLPHLAGVIAERAEVTAGRLCIWARARAGQAACPACGTVSGRVHGRYRRRLADTAIGGRAVVIRLTVRRFCCGNPGCPAVTFAEQVDGLTSRYARRTGPLAAALTAVAVALAGRAGARLGAALGMPASRWSLLRLVMALPDPGPGVVTVLGVDDFSFRRGRSYGTLLVDMDTGGPVDLLPDREAKTLEEWLKAHPGTGVICRDRAGAYAEGARSGAPGAVQVADRWHLWHNLAEYAEKTVAGHRGCLKDQPGSGDAGGSDAPGTGGTAEQEPPGQAEDGKVPLDGFLDACGRERRLVTRTRDRYAEIRARLDAGESLSAISRVTGLDRQTVQRFARAGSAGELLGKATSRESRLDEFKPYICQRWNQGVTDAAALHAELRERGWAGSVQTVRRYVRPFRQAAAAPDPAPAVPKTRQITRWLLTRPDHLQPGEQAQLAAIRARCPHIDALAGHVTAFAEMMTARTGSRDLEAWLAAVEADDRSGLRSLAAGIRTDQQAVTNGLTLPWNSGRVEGTVNKIKMIKRQMYGRAGFDLLRKRVILHPA